MPDLRASGRACCCCLPTHASPLIQSQAFPLSVSECFAHHVAGNRYCLELQGKGINGVHGAAELLVAMNMNMEKRKQRNKVLANLRLI